MYSITQEVLTPVFLALFVEIHKVHSYIVKFFDFQSGHTNVHL